MYIKAEQDYITRWAGLNSTASGYEVITVRKGYKKTRRHTYTVHHFSMHRFYRLTGGHVDIQSNKAVDWRTYLNS